MAIGTPRHARSSSAGKPGSASGSALLKRSVIIGWLSVRRRRPLGRVAQGLLEVLPTQAHSQPEYAYLRQTTRTNNAAVVPEGTVKPTSVYSVVRVEQSLVVVAHLSEGIPRYWLLDWVALEQFVDNELTFGLQLAVEAKVLTDINATSGIQTQSYATSVLTTLRKGLTKLHGKSYYPDRPYEWARRYATRSVVFMGSAR